MRIVNRSWTLPGRVVVAFALAAVMAAGLAPAQEKPVTIPALELMPEQTAIALGLPPIPLLEAKLVPMLEAVAPQLEAAAMIDHTVSDMAEDFAIEEAQDLGDIVAGLGLDPDAPVGVFVDLAPSLESLEPFVEALEEAEEASAMNMDEVIAKHMEIPAMSAVLKVSDKAKAEAAIAHIAGLSPDFDLEGYEKIAAGDLTIRSWGAEVFNYLLTDTHLILGNSLDMVANTAARIAEPTQVRYADADVPKVDMDELVLLVKGGDFVPSLLGLLSAFQAEQDPMVAQMIKSQQDMLTALFTGEGGDDPMIVSIGIDGNKFEIMSRLDAATHPAIIEQWGEGVPLKLATKLHQDTLFFLDFVLTPELKKTISGTYMDVLADQVPEDPGMAQGLTIGRQVLEMLGPEVVVGLSPVADDLPALVLMVQLTNPEATKGLLQLFVPTMPDETYKDVQINDIVAGEVPVPLSLAYLDDAVLVSNNIEEVKRIIDLFAAGEDSDLFASLEPAMDPARPRYSALVMKPQLWTDIVMPLSMLFGAVPDEADMIASQVAARVDEMRLVGEQIDTWSVSSLSMFLKEMDAEESTE
ncbi:MAG: hypothetical protein ACLFTT_01155 [Candidatus Hydrogenedentota bacterium]